MLRFFCFIIFACLLQCVRFEEISATAPEKDVTVGASNLVLVDGCDYSENQGGPDTTFFNLPDSVNRLWTFVSSEGLLRIDINSGRPSGVLFRRMDTVITDFYLKFDLLVQMSAGSQVEIRLGLAQDSTLFLTRYAGVQFEVRPDSVNVFMQAGQARQFACKVLPAAFNMQWLPMTLRFHNGILTLEENKGDKALLPSAVSAGGVDAGALQYLFVQAAGPQIRFFLDNIYLYR